MGLLSGKSPSRIGVVDGRLHPVRSRMWNSVSSFADTEYHKIAPLAAGKNPDSAFAVLRDLVRSSSGAKIVRESGPYLYAEFRTPLLGFVDDVEFLLDAGKQIIHVRSASRLGRKDFGVNRNRIEKLRAALSAKIGA